MTHDAIAPVPALRTLSLLSVLLAGCEDGRESASETLATSNSDVSAATESTSPTTAASESDTADTTSSTTQSATLETSTTAAPSSGEAETTAATAAGVCGNGNPEPPEECDDMNGVDGDACTNKCTLAVCGDGILGPAEECDDENSVDDDACNNLCIVTFCGDGTPQRAIGEDCDDGGESTKCNADCTTAQCGDGVLNTVAGEQCDDGNAQDSDACSTGCIAKQVLDVAMGHDHTCILLSGGKLHCWGYNGFGQLGRGDSEDQGDQPGEVPGPPVPVGDPVVRMAAGIDHTCAVLESGDLRCWGRNHFGQLGYGNTATLGDNMDELPSPSVVVGTDVVDVSVGEWHTCVLTTSGQVRCWGRGNQGALGYGDANTLSAPNFLDVPGVIDVQQLSLAAFASCVRSQQGKVQCWGNNDFGQLGLGHVQALGDQVGEMPPTPIDLGGVAMQFSAGYAHACALMQNGQVRCWGHGPYGKLGTGNSSNVGDDLGDMPPKDVPLGGPAVEVVAGANHSCARMATGRVKCWGRGAHGSLGYASTNDVLANDQSPPQDVDLGGDAKRLWSHLGRATCALLIDDTLRCWGLNANGQLGYGNTNNVGDDETPASVGPVPF
ncbi:DUF4215 domain-containing protein [Nannocystis pusilla]|uniref:RCC1 domain-containing protein n=1 Tax=Nannocystis pusilla TaxID=889268 RepID=UPI003BF2D030